MNEPRTDFLCASPSFLTGFGSVLGLWGATTDYNSSEDPDAVALASDWRMVGQDLREVLQKAADLIPQE